VFEIHLQKIPFSAVFLQNAVQGDNSATGCIGRCAGDALVWVLGMHWKGCRGCIWTGALNVMGLVQGMHRDRCTECIGAGTGDA
jgi:hypothetical protein